MGRQGLQGVLVFTMVGLLACLYREAQGQATLPDCHSCTVDGNNHEYSKCNTSSCQDGYYYVDDSTDITCTFTLTTPGSSLANDNGTTIEATPTMAAKITDTISQPPGPFLCRACADGCKTCNGSDAASCTECLDEYEFREDTNSTTNRTCIKKKDNSLNVGLIAGLSATGGVVVVVAVVVGVCLYCRRRRRMSVEKDQEMGMRGILNRPDSDIDTSQQDTENGNAVRPVRKHKTRKDEKEFVSPKVSKGLEEPTYVNVKTATLGRDDIERGHDKVLRYTRDPTVKKPKFLRSGSEEKELEELPVAPPPPPVGRGPQDPIDVYEPVESPTNFTESTNRPSRFKPKTPTKPKHTSKPAAPAETYEIMDTPMSEEGSPTNLTESTNRPSRFKPKPPTKATKPKHTSKPAAPAETYEIMDTPMSEEGSRKSTAPLVIKTKTGKPPKKFRSNTTVAEGAAPKDNKNQKRPKTQFTNSLPNPSSPTSCPADLPKFPFEESKTAKPTLGVKAMAAQLNKNSKPKPSSRNISPSHPSTEDSESDPEEGYENVPDKGKLAKPEASKRKAHGTVNPAAEDDELQAVYGNEDQQEVYGNQEVIENSKPKPSSRNIPPSHPSPDDSESDPEEDYENMPGKGKLAKPEANDDDRVYGNEISDEEDGLDYQNLPPVKKS